LSLKITVLGSGTSHGVPMIGCDCEVCRSADPRDRRSRPSILVEYTAATAIDAPDGSAWAAATTTILIDTSTDLRFQALAQNVRRVDAVLYTHSHADHIFGLDELRRFNHLQKQPIPCLADARTAADLRRIFAYVFAGTAEKGGGVPQLCLSEVVGPLCLGAVEVIPVPVMHGARPILGYRFGSFAYLTDCNRIPESSWPLLEGVQTLVLDALRERTHPTHFSVSEAVAAAQRIGAARTYFTHISHDLGHVATCARLPPGIELAYDGLVLTAGD
jgi:phosphoribosyl 1,2-cyclic phosphate phosphodiesterase